MLFEAGKDRQACPYVITGGPGSGKSTLLNVLSERGYCCFEEVSRRLIKEQAALGNGIMPWPDIYEQDDERPQTYDEAVSLYHALCKAYDSCGFALHDVPKSSVEKRVAFIEALAVEKKAL